MAAMQAWWFEVKQPEELAALVVIPARVAQPMREPSWRINQDVDHVCASLHLDEGGVAFVARDVLSLATALSGATMDARLVSRQGDALALRMCPFAAPPGGDVLASGTLLLVARRVAFGPAACPLGLGEHRTSLRRLGGLVGALAR